MRVIRCSGMCRGMSSAGVAGVVSPASLQWQYDGGGCGGDGDAVCGGSGWFAASAGLL